MVDEYELAGIESNGLQSLGYNVENPHREKPYEIFFKNPRWAENRVWADIFLTVIKEHSIPSTLVTLENIPVSGYANGNEVTREINDRLGEKGRLMHPASIDRFFMQGFEHYQSEHERIMTRIHFNQS